MYVCVYTYMDKSKHTFFYTPQPPFVALVMFCNIDENQYDLSYTVNQLQNRGKEKSQKTCWQRNKNSNNQNYILSVKMIRPVKSDPKTVGYNL